MVFEVVANEGDVTVSFIFPQGFSLNKVAFVKLELALINKETAWREQSADRWKIRAATSPLSTGFINSQIITRRVQLRKGPNKFRAAPKDKSSIYQFK